MIRSFFRAIGVVLFAAGFIALVSDGIATIAAETLALTPLGETWAALSPGTLDGVRDGLGRLTPLLVDPGLETVVGWPTFAVVGGIGLLLLILTPRRRRRTVRHAD